MKFSDIKEKQQAIELAEDSRQTEWEFTSFIAELFAGRFRWDLIHPFPVQRADDRKIGDAFLASLEECITEHINPSDVDRTGDIPETAIRALAAIGALGMKIPKEYGGLGLSQTNYNRAIALVASHCASTAVFLSAHQSIGVPQPLKLFGTAEQKQKYLPRLAAGEISAFALTEIDVGSDPAQMKTTATPVDDGRNYVINGTKLWCTNGPHASILIVMARTPSITVNGRKKPQITAFIVEADTPGFEVVHRCAFMGLHGIVNGVLRFNDVKVPRENIIGELGKGLKIALITLNTGRLTLPAASAAVDKCCLRYSRRWSLERTQWGLPVGRHQAIAEKLAAMAADTFATDSITWLSSSYVDRGNTDVRLEAAVAKYFATEVTWRIVDDAVQIRGGRGYESAESLGQRGEHPYPLERMMRDTRINRIIEGTSEIMRLFIAREAMDAHFRRLMPLMNPRTSAKTKLTHGIRAVAHYALWYPRQWLPLPQHFRAPHLSRRCRSHLRYISRTSRRLARTLFHAMGRYQQRLEKEQLILAGIVEIGTELFAMAATLAHAEQRIGETPDDRTPGRLADHYCRNARKRIDQVFRDLRDHRPGLLEAIADDILEQRLTWLEDGIVTEDAVAKPRVRGASPHDNSTMPEAATA